MAEQSIGVSSRTSFFRSSFILAVLWVCILNGPSFSSQEAVPAAGSSVPLAVTLRPLSQNEIISPEELRDWQIQNKSFVLLDARDSKAFDAEHIEGAILPLPREFYRQRELFRAKISNADPDMDAALAQVTQEVPKDTPIVTYCNSNCHASAFLLLQLERLGFTNVKAMEAGIDVWKEKGFPMAQGIPRLSSGTLS